MARYRTRGRKPTKLARGARAKRRMSARARVTSGRKPQTPKRGMTHYLVRNIPKDDWKEFRRSHEAPREAIIAFISREAAATRLARAEERASSVTVTVGTEPPSEPVLTSSPGVTAATEAPAPAEGDGEERATV